MPPVTPFKLGPFILEHRLGRGGMGTVYRAFQEETKAPVAVKILAESLAEDVSFQNRFLQEIEALRQLRHPNIVRFYGYGREEMYFYYVMELVEGRSLEEEIHSGRNFGWRETLSYAIQIASALNCAHVHGIIHRDLKPANLMLTPEGVIKLSDFGIATLFGSDKITSVGSVVGTINYMAPEQAAAQPVTTRTDLYAFGAVLVALLTGHPPFSASTLPEILHLHATGPARRPSQLGIDLPVEFDELIGRLLERNPDRRPKNAYFVLRLLEAMQEELTGTSVSEEVSAVKPLSTDILQQKILANRSVPEQELELDLEETPVSESGMKSESECESESESESEAECAPESESESAVNPVSEAVSGTVWFQSFSNDRKNNAAEKNSAASGETELYRESENVSSPEMTPAAENRGTGETPVPEKGGTSEIRYFHDESAAPKKKKTTFWESPWWGLIVILSLSGGSIGLVSHIIRHWSTPPAADELYEHIMKAAEDEDAENSSAFAKDVSTFLICYSRDPRAGKVQEFQSDIDLNRMEKRLFLSPRGRQFRSMEPIERDYLHAVENLQAQPEITLKRLENFIIFYDSVCENLKKDSTFSHEELLKRMRFLEIAKRQIFRIRTVAEKEQAQRRELVKKEIENVRTLLKSEDPEEREHGEALRQAMLNLYHIRDPEAVAPLLEMQPPLEKDYYHY